MRKRGLPAAASLLLLGVSWGLAWAPAAAYAGSAPQAEVRASAPAMQSAGSSFTTSLIYAQSSDAWKTVNAIKGAQGDLSAINDILHRNYGSYEEAFGRFDAGLSGLRTGFVPGPLERAYFRASAEGVGTGLAQNPVVPELHASALAGGGLGAGFQGRLRRLGLLTSFGAVAGAGYEKRVDAYSTDVIESLPIRSGSFCYLGFDVSLAREFSLGRETDARLAASDRETRFSSSTPAASLSYDTDSVFWAHRWRLDGSLSFNPRSGAARGSRFFLEGVAGPQPLPEEILPRIWDYAHHLDPLPELGTLLGGGAGWETRWGRGSRIRLHGGFYGGYWGAGLATSLGRLQLSAGSWGIEGSSAYRTLGQRVWLGSLGVAI